MLLQMQPRQLGKVAHAQDGRKSGANGGEEVEAAEPGNQLGDASKLVVLAIPVL